MEDAVLAMAVRRALTAGVSNVQFILTNGKAISEYFAKGEVQQLYLNFSDPWPKKRHEKRRLTAPNF